MQKKPLSTGAKALARFVEKNGMTKTAAAAGVGVSVPTLLDYLSGAKRPNSIRREVIERYTGGAVSRNSWDFPAERAELESTTPFGAASAEAADAAPSPEAAEAKGAA